MLDQQSTHTCGQTWSLKSLKVCEFEGRQFLKTDIDRHGLLTCLNLYILVVSCIFMWIFLEIFFYDISKLACRCLHVCLPQFSAIVAVLFEFL